MSEPAGELEDLDPPEDGKPARATQRSALTSLSLRARIALFIGVAVFTVGALVQILAAIWLGFLAALFGGSAEVLLHTGGLERETFAVCSVVAVVIDAALLILIAATSARRSWRRGAPAKRERFAVRHPVVAAGLWLSCALVFVVVLGWSPSAYFPYPLATIIVLANAYFLGLVGALALARLADVAWRRVKVWGLASQYRAGFLTACLLLVGGVGYWWLTTRWYVVPLHEAQAWLEAEDLDDDPGVLAGELEGLCIVAGKLEPPLAHSSAAPACGFLTSGTKGRDACFEALMTSAVPDAKQKLRRSGLNDYDLEDAIMKAMLATCTREPPPVNIAGYFYTVALNQTRQVAQEARRTVSCDRLDEQPAACSSSDPPEIREFKLAKLWEDAFCRLNAKVAEIVRRRLEQDESFREIGKHVGVSETKAKDTFHNAIKMLRNRGLMSCDDLGF